MKKKITECAVIEIGTNNTKMGIYQLQKNNISCLDDLIYPLDLGNEIFNSGYVEFSSINELSEILSRYKIVCDGFGINNIKTVSTSVMRDAKNQKVIADRIFTKNDFHVEILPDSKEKSLIYFDIINKLKKDNYSYNNTIIAYIGSGSMGIAKFDGENITHSSYIPLGSVKFHDILKSLKSGMLNYHEVIEEYLHTVFAKLNLSDCDCLVLSGTETQRIAMLCGKNSENGIYTFEKDDLKNLHHSTRNYTGENIASKYKITENDANMMLTSLSICYELSKSLNNQAKIKVSTIDFKTIIAEQMLLPNVKAAYDKHIYNSSLTVAKIQAEKYNCNIKHSNNVIKFSNLLFDKLKKVHGLDDNYKHIIELGAILHSCGQYISTRQRSTSAFDLIKNMDIYGMTYDEILLVAFISSYNEFSKPDANDMKFMFYSNDREMIISKLVAIFRIANALDKSQKSKLSITKLKIEDNILTIRANTNESAYLEEWTFNQCAEYFTEIFGITPKLIIKSQLI